MLWGRRRVRFGIFKIGERIRKKKKKKNLVSDEVRLVRMTKC